METILVATDFSPAANNALDYAVELAKFFSCRLVLVNSFPVPVDNYNTGMAVEVIGSMEKNSQEGLLHLAEGVKAKHQGNLEIECHSSMGFVLDVITSAAEKFNADIIVMGIIGKAGAIKEHIIGSTAVKVARNCELPCLIVPESCTYQPIHKISFACDMDKTEETDLVYVAKYFAKIFGAKLEIVTIEDPAAERSFEKARTGVFVEKKLDSMDHAMVSVSEKNVARGLEEYLEMHEPDLLLMNPKKHNVFHALFKESVTKELAFHAHLPVLTIH